VLNADDDTIAGLAELCDGSVVFYSLLADHPLIAAHRAEQGCAVFVRDQQIVLAEGNEEHLVGRLDSFALTRGRTGNAGVANVLAACGAARALGVSPELIGAGIKTYEGEPGHMRRT
jgi:cyanophycin synthetase